MRKKVLALVLALCMVLTLLPTTVFAAARQEYSPTLVEVKVGGTDVTPKASGTSQPTNFTNGVWLPTAISSFEESGIEVTAKDSATLTYAVNDQYSMTAEQITATVLATELEKLSDTNNKLWIKAVKDGTTEIVGMSFAVMASNADSLAKILGETNAEENTVKLSKNVTVDKVIKVKLGEDAVTLDLNGHSITGEVQGDNNTTGSILSLEAGTLTITDNSNGDTKGSISNTAAKNSADDSSAVQISNATLTVKGVTLSGGNNVVKVSGKNASLTVTGAIIKAVNAAKDDAIAINASSSPKLTISADTDAGATEVHGKMNGMWAEGSKISGGYYTDFTLNAVTGGKSILETGYGLVPVDNDKQSTFTYKVGTVDANSAEGYVEIDDDAKVYGSIDMLVEFYGRTDKTIYVQKNATLTLAEFGDVVGGKYGNGNTLTFEADSELQQDVTLTISGTIKVGLITYSGTHLLVTDQITPVSGYSKQAAASGQIKYDIDKTSSNAVAEVTIDDNTYTYGADALQNLFLTIQGQTAEVKLLQDVENTNQILLVGNTNLTLDLNGHTYTYTGPKGAAIIAEKSPAAVTIADSSEGKTGILDGSKNDLAISAGDMATGTDKAKITVDKGVKIKGSICVFANAELDFSGEVEAVGPAIQGNGTCANSTITIKNGAKVTSTNSAAIYHPQEGALIIGESEVAEGSSAPVITGKAGVVVRDGTVTVNDATVTATGTEPLQVGDAKDPVPAGGIVLDKADGYNTATDNKVTVEKATVTVEEGQPTVTYTEEGKAPDYSTEEKAPTSHVEVKSGTYTSGDEADTGVVPFIDSTNSGLTSEGKVDTAANVANSKLFLVDFGYLANAPAGMSSSKNTWTSPNGITYTVYNSASDHWGDATFYWAFNRALTQAEATAKVKVTFTCGDQTFTDTCEAQGVRFASSILNTTQNTSGAVVEVSDWTISSPDNNFTIPDEYKTAKVELPKSVKDNMPVVTAATLGEGAQTTAGSVTAQITKADNTKKEYTVAVEAKDLHSHANADGTMGYWVGFAVEVPTESSYTGFYYKFGDGKWGFSKLETIAENTQGVAFYFADTKNTDVLLLWTADETAGADPTTGYITFHVDFTGVERYVEPTPGAPTYTVTVPANPNGTVTVSPTSATAGTTITVTVTPKEGYSVDTVTVTQNGTGTAVTVTKNANGTYSFTMPAGGATVQVTFVEGTKPAPSAKFTDVVKDAWYVDAIDYVVEHGLMGGTGDTTFAPNDPTTRAMLVTILYRLDGEPAVTKNIPFSDVATGEWYSDAINWAAANEIVGGYGDDTFRPERDLTREEAATILYRYATYKKYDVTTTAALTSYTDAASVQSYATAPMSWAVGTELINGTTATTLAPTGGAIRAQIATILMRFCENIVK